MSPRKLIKNGELEIPESEPFKYDCLNRRNSINFLTSLIQEIDVPFVFSVEAPWGGGKTTFIRLWEASLPSDIACVRFNAWETDYFEDPLLAFISEITSQLDEKFGNDEIKQIFSSIKRIGGKVARVSLPILIELLTKRLLTEERLKAFSAAITDNEGNVLAGGLSDFSQEMLDDLEGKKKDIKEFKQELSKLVQKVQEKNNNKYPLIIFVDELDRCRPDYALNLLERIKHLFNIEDVVFVLSVDRSQLSQIVKAVYGTEDPDEYIRRFIDLSFKIPEPSRRDFCQMLFTKHKFDNRHIADCHKSQFLVARFGELADHLKLSLRAIEQCFIQFDILLNIDASGFCDLLYFLVALKAKDQQTYNLLRNKKCRINMPYPQLPETEKGDIRAAVINTEGELVGPFVFPERYFPNDNKFPRISDEVKTSISTMLWYHVTPSNHLEKYYARTKSHFNKENIECFIDTWESLRSSNGKEVLAQIFSSIDMASGFYK